MQKGKKHQTKKLSGREILNIFSFIISLCLLSYTVFFTAQKIILCNNIKNSNLLEYSGKFEIIDQTRTRNTISFIILENGDTLRCDPGLIENSEELDSNTNLRFIYSTPRYVFPSAYCCVEIASIEGEMVFLDKSVSYDEAKGLRLIGVVLSVVTFFITLVLSQNIANLLKKTLKRTRKRR